MATSELLSDFRRDYAKLTEAQRKAFRLAVKKFVIDLRRGGPFRGSLRVKPMQDNPNNFEMTWEGQGGRAPFDHGPAQWPGEKHVRWRPASAATRSSAIRSAVRAVRAGPRRPTADPTLIPTCADARGGARTVETYSLAQAPLNLA